MNINGNAFFEQAGSGVKLFQSNINISEIALDNRFTNNENIGISGWELSNILVNEIYCLVVIQYSAIILLEPVITKAHIVQNLLPFAKESEIVFAKMRFCERLFEVAGSILVLLHSECNHSKTITIGAYRAGIRTVFSKRFSFEVVVVGLAIKAFGH